MYEYVTNLESQAYYVPCSKYEELELDSNSQSSQQSCGPNSECLIWHNPVSFLSFGSHCSANKGILIPWAFLSLRFFEFHCFRERYTWAQCTHQDFRSWQIPERRNHRFSQRKQTSYLNVQRSYINKTVYNLFRRYYFYSTQKQ